VLGIDQQRLGTGLLVFGLVGVIVAGIVAAGLFGGAVAARGLADRVATDQQRLVTTLSRLTATIDKLATASDNAGATLTTTSTTLDNAGDVLDGLASVSDELSRSLNFSVLGQQPLAGAATRFGDLAGRIRVFRDDADALSTRLQANASDVSGIAGELHQISTQIGETADRVAAFGRTDELVGLVVAGTLLVGLLVGWVAVAAGICAWLGWRLRRAAREAGTADAVPG
jgi:methyl-accepting chemotaxis protein